MADDFDVQVGQWVRRARENARIAFVAIGFEALSRVKELTPVRTGWLRSNWQIQREGEAVPVQRSAIPTDPVEAQRLLDQLKAEAEEGRSPAALAEAAAQAQLGEKLRIVNPVIYARAVEYGREIERKDGGITTTTAAGMAAQTALEIPEMARAIVDAIRQGRSRV
jgi:hypothetical protein